MKKYYVTVDDSGNEVGRKLTTHHELEDLDTMTLKELSEVYYETSAEYASKARKIDLLEDLINKRHHKGEYLNTDEFTQREIDRNIIEASNNIIDMQQGE